ncbi:hypothetical protein D4R20_00105 [bacterium]|nr:MAG: hypothetical protein D4R20_00105 [bacterium]
MINRTILFSFLSVSLFGYSQKPEQSFMTPCWVKTFTANFTKFIPAHTIIYSGLHQYITTVDLGVGNTLNSAISLGKAIQFPQENSVSSKVQHDTVFVDKRNYKVFTGYINQTDTTPVAVSELENTIGNITWSWDGNHLVLNAVLNGAFTVGLAVAYAIDPVEGFKGAGVNYVPDRITWELLNYSGSITNLLVEIRVYQ